LPKEEVGRQLEQLFCPSATKSVEARNEPINDRLIVSSVEKTISYLQQIITILLQRKPGDIQVKAILYAG